MDYVVNIEINGVLKKAGTLKEDSQGGAYFQYDEEYLSDRTARAISISLPKQNEAFSTSRTEVFFDGLLPEGFTRHAVADAMHLDENNYIPLLYLLGRECLGAVQITSTDDTFIEKYLPVTNTQIRKRLSCRHPGRQDWDVQ